MQLSLSYIFAEVKGLFPGAILVPGANVSIRRAKRLKPFGKVPERIAPFLDAVGVLTQDTLPENGVLYFDLAGEAGKEGSDLRTLAAAALACVEGVAGWALVCALRPASSVGEDTERSLVASGEAVFPAAAAPVFAATDASDSGSGSKPAVCGNAARAASSRFAAVGAGQPEPEHGSDLELASMFASGSRRDTDISTTDVSGGSDLDACPCILLPRQEDVPVVMGFVSQLLARCGRLSDVMRDAVIHTDLQRLVKACGEFCDNPVYICGPDFKMISYHAGLMAEIDPIWRYHTRYRYLPYNVMKSLVETGEIDACHACSHAAIVADTPSFQTPYLCRAIMRHRTCYGLFIILKLNHAVDARDAEIADFAGDLLAQSVELWKDGVADTTGFYHAHFLSDVAEGGITDEKQIARQISVFGWGIDDPYRVFTLDAKGDDEAIRQQLLACLQPICPQAFSHRDAIVCILHGREVASENVWCELAHIVRIFNRSAGVSERFLGFAQLPAFYRQALYALNHAKGLPDACGGVSGFAGEGFGGGAHEGAQNGARDSAHGGTCDGAQADAPVEVAQIVRYEQVFIDQVSELVAGIMPPAQAVRELARIDHDANSELCRTLYVWLLSDGNTVNAAQQLYVHRNTVNYRLERIRGVVGTGLDDLGVRMRLLLSLRQMHS